MDAKETYEAIVSKLEYTKKKALLSDDPKSATVKSAILKISEGTELSETEKTALKSALEYTFKKDLAAYDPSKVAKTEKKTKKSVALEVLNAIYND